MEVDANSVIQKLLDQLRQFHYLDTMKDIQIEILQKQIAELSAEKEEVK